MMMNYHGLNEDIPHHIAQNMNDYDYVPKEGTQEFENFNSFNEK